MWGLLGKPMIAVQPANHPGSKPAKSVWRGTNAIPSWSWAGCEGNKTVVEVYTGADTVELLLNGNSLDKKKVKDCKAVFKVIYAPGTLSAVTYDRKGNQVGQNQLTNVQGKTSILLTPEVSETAPGGILYVDITLSGENGQREANADETLQISVSGGELLGFGSANPRTEERYQAGAFTTYYGKAQAVIRAGKNGELKIKVSGKKTGSAEVNVPVSAEI